MANEVMDRLRNATPNELAAFAEHLEEDLGADHAVNLVRLSDAYQEIGWQDYQTVLSLVGAHVASEAKWKKMPEVDEVETAWLLI